jgi:hypothetical protein
MQIGTKDIKNLLMTMMLKKTSMKKTKIWKTFSYSFLHGNQLNYHPKGWFMESKITLLKQALMNCQKI